MNFRTATGNGGRRGTTCRSRSEVLSTWLQCHSIWPTDMRPHRRVVVGDNASIRARIESRTAGSWRVTIGSSPCLLLLPQLAADPHQDLEVSPLRRRVRFLVVVGLEHEVAGGEQDSSHLGVLLHLLVHRGNDQAVVL